jgi:hypothetical protein
VIRLLLIKLHIYIVTRYICAIEAIVYIRPSIA